MAPPTKALRGSICMRGTTYSHYSIAQLKTPEGLLLQPGQQQRVRPCARARGCRASLMTSGTAKKRHAMAAAAAAGGCRSGKK
jgi:hypothetical protein